MAFSQVSMGVAVARAALWKNESDILDIDLHGCLQSDVWVKDYLQLLPIEVAKNPAETESHYVEGNDDFVSGSHGEDLPL
jgi:hypothetical protein